MCGCHLFIGANSLTQPATAQEMNAAHRFYHLGLVVWSERPVFSKSVSAPLRSIDLAVLGFKHPIEMDLYKIFLSLSYSHCPFLLLFYLVGALPAEISRTAAAKIHAWKELKSLGKNDYFAACVFPSVRLIWFDFTMKHSVTAWACRLAASFDGLPLYFFGLQRKTFPYSLCVGSTDCDRHLFLSATSGLEQNQRTEICLCAP